jgi:hypothetical protein
LRRRPRTSRFPFVFVLISPDFPTLIAAYKSCQINAQTPYIPFTVAKYPNSNDLVDVIWLEKPAGSNPAYYFAAKKCNVTSCVCDTNPRTVYNTANTPPSFRTLAQSTTQPPRPFMFRTTLALLGDPTMFLDASTMPLWLSRAQGLKCGILRSKFLTTTHSSWPTLL